MVYFKATAYILLEIGEMFIRTEPSVFKYHGACTSYMPALSADLCCISDFCNEFR